MLCRIEQIWKEWERNGRISRHLASCMWKEKLRREVEGNSNTCGKKQEEKVKEELYEKRGRGVRSGKCTEGISTEVKKRERGYKQESR